VYVSPDSALARARRELSEFDDVFEPGVLPGSIELRLRPGFGDPRTVARLAERMRGYPGVEEVRYGEEWVQKLHRLRTVAAVAGAALGGAFAAVAIVIIGSTIRVAVLARAREIAIMRLVGATSAFVRRPFLIEGFLKGTLGGGLALLLTYGTSNLLSRYFLETRFFSPEQAAAGVAAGALLGLLGSALSVSRHLRGV
jgi:cell division transport system permease protein